MLHSWTGFSRTSSKHTACERVGHINPGRFHHTRTLITTPQSIKSGHSCPFKMATQHSMATFETDDDHPASPSLLTASDTREQIIANSLVVYPNVVQEHINKFPNIPVRAADIFDVCVVDVTKQYGGTGHPKYIAKLTHAHEKHPAARMFLMSGSARATVYAALDSLLAHSIGRLGVDHDTLLPAREGCIEQHHDPDAGWAFHVDTTRNGLVVAGQQRKLATEFNMAKK